MKPQSLLIVLACLLGFSTLGQGQNKSLSNVYLAKTYSVYKNTDASIDHRNFFEAMAGKMHLADQSSMKLVSVRESDNGYAHYKYQQYYAGLPIFGNMYILHEKNGVLENATGRYSPQVLASARPSVSASTALAKAKLEQNAKVYATENPAPALCYIDPAFPKMSETLRLAYQVDLYSTEPMDKRRYFIDAVSGNLICQLPLILEEGVPSTGKTKYYGIQNIITDSIAPQLFELRDLTRGDGIFVTGPNNNTFSSNSSNWDLTNAAQDEVALDAHYCAESYYDMMLQMFDWRGLDGQGKALKLSVHDAGAGNVNAYWDGESTNYGDGNCIYGPLTTLEVVGHEFTHGMIDYTSQLVYGSESGAINESLADMFGKILERKKDPANFSWDLGHSFLLSPEAKPFRVMDDPTSVQMPAFYNGLYWDEFADVHTNSSIGNLWFSMMVDGKQGVNEIGQSFNVPALGVDKVGQIIFLVNEAYFTPTSNYAQFSKFSALAAETLFGQGSMEVLAVKEAWKAVGVLADPGVGQPFDLSLDNSGFFLYTCGLNTPFSFTVSIINSSSEAFDPATMSATLTLTASNLPLYTLPITDPIGPGERLDLQIDNWYITSQLGFDFVDVQLDVVDANPDNNYSNIPINIVEYPAGDLTMFGYIGQSACFSPTQAVFYFITNNSCETLPVGAMITLSAEDLAGNTLWSEPYTLTEEVGGFSLLFVQKDIPLNLLGNNPIIILRVAYASDLDITNNVTQATISNAAVIDNNYVNNFNNLDNTLVADYVSSNPLVLYQGNSYFGSTGIASDPETFTPCPDYTKSFNSEQYDGVNANLRACVDLSAFASPSLSFDMVLFRNTYAVNTNYDYSSMLQVSWTGNSSGSDIIFDQPEGLKKYHSYPLPANFKGEVLLKLYTEIGDWELTPSTFNTNDYVLVDNLQFKTTVGTKELEQKQWLNVSPNPANERVIVQANGTIKTLLLQHINGQTLRSVAVNDSNFELNLEGLASGMYLLNVLMEDGKQAVQKLVKMD